VPHKPTGVSAEDVAAGAYFPAAKDWLDIGRRRLRYQIDRYSAYVTEKSGGRYRVTFPLNTEAAFMLLSGLGYRATRKHFDYCIRHNHMELPPKQDGRLAWGIENVIDFGMQLERLRYWVPGRHDEKKTVWERQYESDSSTIALIVANDPKFQSLDVAGILKAIIATESRDVRAAMSDYLPIRLFEVGAALNELGESLLRDLVDATDSNSRRNLVKFLSEQFVSLVNQIV